MRCAERGAPRGLALMLAASLGAGLAAPGSAASQEAYQELQRFSGVLNHIRLNYVDEVGYAELVRGSIDGALRSLDPHSSFFARADWNRLDALDRGLLAGAGVKLDELDGAIVVRVVQPEGPAERAGVLPGDRVVAVAGATVQGLSPREVELRLAGDDGSRVRVELERGPRLDPQPYQVELRRAFVVPRSVHASALVDDTTGYVALGQFGEDAADELEDALRSLERAGARRFLLDLRGNPGGLVTQAVDVAALFLPDDSPVFRTEGRKTEVNQSYATRRGGRFRDVPLVVLLDRGSASAAEALAATLQDHDRAVLAGRRSFGKALMQAPFFLAGGDVVWLTIGRVVSPSGRVIQRPYRGVRVEEYRAGAGDGAQGGAAEDSARVYTTAAGRPVRGGGGVRPDVELPEPVELPVWWTEAMSQGLVHELVDSVAAVARTGERAWLLREDQRRARLAESLIERVRDRFGLDARAEPELVARIGRVLALLVTETAWGRDAGVAFRLAVDPDVRAALPLFDRAANILGHEGGARR